MDDKRGSRLPLSISDRCCGDMPTLADNISSVRRRWLRWRPIGGTGLNSYLNWYKLAK
jgi:hypothetical protein